MRARFFAMLLVPVLLSTGTEATAQVSTPEVPDPALCRTEPRPQAELLPLLSGTPAAAPAATDLPASVTAEAQLPSGTPADAATVAAITATARELIACNNAGDFGRVFAFYTDEFIRRAFGGDPTAREQVPALLATPAAPLPPEARTTLLAVRDVRVLADGRVGAIMEDVDPRQKVTVFLIFAQVGDRWLVDGQIDIATEGTPVP